jgi:hypothetical protein
VINESLRLYPAAAGLQRRSINSDFLDGWSILPGRAMGISLIRLHANTEYFGEAPDQFRPARYVVSDDLAAPGKTGDHAAARSCPVHQPNRWPPPVGAKTKNGICLPLSFGAGVFRAVFRPVRNESCARRPAPALRLAERRGFRTGLDLNRFALFIALHPLDGVHLRIARRHR